MNTLFSAVLMLLGKWTCLVALAWLANWLLRARRARWRLLLWRSILCFGLALPLTPFLPLPSFWIPIAAPAGNPSAVPEAIAMPATVNPAPKNSPGQLAPVNSAADSKIIKSPYLPPSPLVVRKISWPVMLTVLWGVGVALAGYRLLWIQAQLHRLRQAARPADPAIQDQLRELWTRLGPRQVPEIYVSDAITSPFACGLIHPMILLPQKLIREFSAGEFSALLAHETAHFRQHDLFWCVGWRWLQVLCWFHPLVWNIPAAHGLACEQEADRIAASQLQDRELYPQLLARLALRVLALPPVETRLALNGSAQITRRLDHLKKGPAGNWTWRHSMIGWGLASLLFLVVTGCKGFKANPETANSAAAVEFKKFLVVVQDDEGKPIVGATIMPHGFRVKGRHSPDAYGWNEKLFGPAEKVVTDRDGKAWVRYPVEAIPEEKEFTGQLILLVAHPEFADVFNQGYSVDSPEPPIHLVRGIHLDVTAYYGQDHQPVTNLVPVLTDGEPLTNWQTSASGMYRFHKLSPGGHLLQLMGRLPTGEIVYADPLAFTAEKGKPCRFDLELKPGIRLEGRLDDSVPRPVKNGRVMISVRPPEYPALNVIDDFYDLDQKYGGHDFWHSYRPINEDGTFVFESLPPGEADISVLGDGFTIKSTGKLQNRVNGALVKGPSMSLPQAVPLTAPVITVEVATEPTATLEFTATTKSGEPLADIWAGMFPSVYRLPGMAGWEKTSSEATFRDLPRLPAPEYSGQTDNEGKLVIPNLPPEARGLDVDSPKYQVPLQDPKGWRDRHIRIQFAPGMTNYFTLQMEPKGTDFVGTAK